jgi:hypothetical protein
MMVPTLLANTIELIRVRSTPSNGIVAVMLMKASCSI